MWLCVMFLLGVLTIPAVNWALESNQSNRVFAILGLLAWPWRSIYIWIKYGGSKEELRNLGYFNAMKSMSNIMYQLRTNEPWYTRVQKEG